MSKTIQTIDLVRWSEPDEQHRVKELGMSNAQEVFNKLEAHLKENNLLPDEYFLFDSYNDWKDKELPGDAEFICHTNYGGSEGIYLDIGVIDGSGKRTRYATGKTLGETTEDFLRMSRIGAECLLMLNSYGNKIEIKETPEIAYRLNRNEETVYTIIDRQGTDTLLRRHTLNPETDPTPFIVANGVKIDNGLIEWDSGRYFSNLMSATNDFFETNKITIINRQLSEDKNFVNLIEKTLPIYLNEIEKENPTPTNEKNEVNEINNLLSELQRLNNLYDSPYFFDYEGVISALKEAQQTIEKSLRCERPENLPDDLIWSEKVSNGLDDDEFDPFVYDGSMSIEDFRKVQEAALAETVIDEKSDNISVAGHIGTWYVIDTKIYNNEKLFLLEHEEYGDETACLIIDGNRNIKIDDVWNGFDDYDEFLSSQEILNTPPKMVAETAVENNNIKEEKSMEAQIITIYQTEDKKHFSLRKIKNNGTYDETANCTSSLYELPKGFHTENILGIFEIADDKNHYFEVLNSNDKPVLIDLSAYEGKITKEYVEKVGIPLEKIQENTFRNIYEKNELSRISREEARKTLTTPPEMVAETAINNKNNIKEEKAMDIKVNVTPVEKEDGKVKGYASVILDNCFAVNSIKVMEGSNGLFVSYPNYKKGEEYKNICNPTTAEMREKLNNAILEKYNEKVQAQTVVQSQQQQRG